MNCDRFHTLKQYTEKKNKTTATKTPHKSTATYYMKESQKHSSDPVRQIQKSTY